MALPSIPPPATAFLNADGTVNRTWYLFLYNLAEQSMGVTAQGGGAVSPGSGQADAAILWNEDPS